MVIKLLVGYFQSMKLSHLLRANSPINTIRQVVKQQTTNEDGQPEEKSETIFRAALNMTDWMEHNPTHLTQVSFDRDRAALIDALELAMGTKAFESCFEVNKTTGWKQLDSLLPYQIWIKCKEKLINQQVRSTQHMRTKLAGLRYRIGDDFKDFRARFTDLLEDIEKVSPDVLDDNEIIPTLNSTIEGHEAVDHPFHAPIARINELLEDTKHNALYRTDIPPRMTLEIALDTLQKRYEELQGTSEETALKVHAAIAQLEDFGFDVDGLNARAFAAHTPNFRGGGARTARGVNLDLARGAAAAAQQQPGDLPYRGMRGVCWKCASTDHADWRQCPTVLRQRAHPPPPPAAATNDQLMATLVQNQQAQQRTLDTLVQALQNLQTNRGTSNGLLAAGAPPVAPAAAPAADQAAMFINQPTFNPADLHRRFPDEEPAGTSDSYGFQQGYDVYGSDDEA